MSRIRLLEEGAFRSHWASEYIACCFLRMVVRELTQTSLWASIRASASAREETWRTYATYQLSRPTPLVDLWPCQRAAIAGGLLDGASSMVIQMPTSAGKTKLTELAFVNDLFTHEDAKCLYIAPFRALVTEVGNEIGQTMGALGIPVASLCGGSEANELELELTNLARVVIATPEKIAAVLRHSGHSLLDFGTIVLDEGHLLDSWQRGTAYEFAARVSESGSPKT